MYEVLQAGSLVYSSDIRDSQVFDWRERVDNNTLVKPPMPISHICNGPGRTAKATMPPRLAISMNTSQRAKKYPGLNPHAELGQIIVGHHPGRELVSQKILAFNYGLAIFDLLSPGRS